MVTRTDTKITNIKFFWEKEKHHFHLVDSSQLPIVTAISALLLVLSFVYYWHPLGGCVLSKLDKIFFQCSFVEFITVLFCWFITVIYESGQGYHTNVVRKGLRWGMALFIVSEIMFFFAFFWAFFHVSLSPAVAIGCIWPPISIQPLDIWDLPLMNTILLLSSGVTITLAHRAILKVQTYTNIYQFEKFLFVTIILGIVFLCCQSIEYKYGVGFTWKENIYGSTFFVLTGFHGLHVTIGTIFLLFCLIRSFVTNLQIKNNVISSFYFKIKQLSNYLSYFSFRKEQHLGFEAAAWYWHFVDVVWIFLFITVYWWGS